MQLDRPKSPIPLLAPPSLFVQALPRPRPQGTQQFSRVCLLLRLEVLCPTGGVPGWLAKPRCTSCLRFPLQWLLCQPWPCRDSDSRQHSLTRQLRDKGQHGAPALSRPLGHKEDSVTAQITLGGPHATFQL